MGDILSNHGTGRLQEPPEVQIIKDWLRDRYQVAALITVQTNQIVITVPSAALAGSLRMELHHLQDVCGTNRRLVIRIGS